jgi:hypothetical protein
MGELSTSEAVRVFGTHPNVLNRLILMGRLDARKNPDGSGRWLITRASLDRWNSRRVRRSTSLASAL